MEKTKKEINQQLEAEEDLEERIEERSSKITLVTKELNDLEDVVITSLADNHILKYDSASGKWKNEAP